MIKNYLLAIATLIGTIIGVGIFAIPYVINQSGVLPLIIFMPILTAIQYYLHLLYAEVVLSTKVNCRLPGFVGRYGDNFKKNLTLVITVLSDSCTLIAYIIVGGLFLHQLLNPIFNASVLFYAVLLFIFEAFIILFGIRAIASVEFIMSLFLIITIAMIGWRGQYFFNLNNYHVIDWSKALLPYGPIFFAVGGGAAIPEVCKLLARNKNKIKSAIFWGTLIPAVIMFIFIIIIVGITGPNTTPDTLSGLNIVFKDGIIKLALILGLLAIITSFLTIAQSLREVFWWDFKINKNFAWLIACFLPFLLYLFGIRNITKLVSLTGAIGGGIMGIILIWLVLRIKNAAEQESVIKNKINKPMVYILSLLFILGFIYEISVIFK